MIGNKHAGNLHPGDCGDFLRTEKSFFNNKLVTYLCPECQSPLRNDCIAPDHNKWVCCNCGTRGEYLISPLDSEKKTKRYKIEAVPKKMRILATEIPDGYSWVAYASEQENIARNCPSCGAKDAILFSIHNDQQVECPHCHLKMNLKRSKVDGCIMGKVISDPNKNYFVEILVKPFFPEDVVFTERDEEGMILCPCCNNALEMHSPILYSGKVVTCPTCRMKGVIFNSDEKDPNLWKVTILHPAQIFQEDCADHCPSTDLATAKFSRIV